jgi:hypothetical protein
LVRFVPYFLSMNQPTPALVHLAAMIDAKEMKLERTKTPFVRRRLLSDLDSLMRRFQLEYQVCMASDMASELLGFARSA